MRIHIHRDLNGGRPKLVLHILEGSPLGSQLPRHTYVGDHESELDEFWLGLGTVATLAGDVGHPIDHPLKTKTPKGPSLVLLTWLPVAGLPLANATVLST